MNYYTAGDITAIPAKAGSYYVGPDVTGMPIDGYGWLVSVDSDGATTAITAHNGNRRYIRYGGYDGIWQDWVSIATATPPQEYDLPLAAGVTWLGRYSKSQDNLAMVTPMFTVAAGMTDGQLLATLPAGYRPKYTLSGPAFANSTSVVTIVRLEINTAGEIRVKSITGGGPLTNVMAWPITFYTA